MTMGHYNTRALPIYAYLHEKSHPNYVIEDNFFQAAFGGSFLNHQYLIAAAPPTYPNAPANLHSIIDSNGMPVKYPLYTPTGPVQRGPLTVVCPSPVAERACGDFAVNTMQPTSQPSGSFGAKLPLQTAPTIGDRLTRERRRLGLVRRRLVERRGRGQRSGLDERLGPDLFGSERDHRTRRIRSVRTSCSSSTISRSTTSRTTRPGRPGVTHLQDEVAFEQLAAGSSSTCELKPVSFIKPIGEENEHPGYASEPNGSDIS